MLSLTTILSQKLMLVVSGYHFVLYKPCRHGDDYLKGGRYTHCAKAAWFQNCYLGSSSSGLFATVPVFSLEQRFTLVLGIRC